jgi:large subunit ribosomal protein L30
MKTAEKRKLKIKLVRGRSAADKKQSRILDALGLGKTNSLAYQNDSASILGMLNKVAHLVEVSENK